MGTSTTYHALGVRNYGIHNIKKIVITQRQRVALSQFERIEHHLALNL